MNAPRMCKIITQKESTVTATPRELKNICFFACQSSICASQHQKADVRNKQCMSKTPLSAVYFRKHTKSIEQLAFTGMTAIYCFFSSRLYYTGRRDMILVTDRSADVSLDWRFLIEAASLWHYCRPRHWSIANRTSCSFRGEELCQMLHAGRGIAVPVHYEYSQSRRRNCNCILVVRQVSIIPRCLTGEDIVYPQTASPTDILSTILPHCQFSLDHQIRMSFHNSHHCEDLELRSQCKGVQASTTVCRVTNLVRKHRNVFILLYLFVCIVCAYFGASLTPFDSQHGHVTNHDSQILRRWGGFDEKPTSNRCYRQERISMLLALFVGFLGVDQWYAHHWVPAVFKTFGPILVGVAFHCVSGVFPKALMTSVVLTWSLIDVVLWIVGGVYGTPGCPGGSSMEWLY